MNVRYFDLHRHDEKSVFDGFGKAEEFAKRAVELEYKALAISNHGNSSACVEHYYACKEAGIKPILGAEVYFMPEFEEVRDNYHLCLYAKNLKGYKNLNRIISYANQRQYYYKPIVDYALLEKYSEGLICTSACAGGYISTLISNKKVKSAREHSGRLQEIFGEDFYIEIQPYDLSDKNLQLTINVNLMSIADKLGVKCILTSDSHYVRKDDFDTYLIMHDIAGHKDFGAGYSERYMPSEKEIKQRFMNMHDEYIDGCDRRVEEYLDNLSELADKVEDTILEHLPLKLPSFGESSDSHELLWQHIMDGLKSKNKASKAYMERAKFEFDVIAHHGFEDYFLIVEDYVKWARNQGILVGPGRGSVCNVLVAYALGITDVDSLYFDLDFNRFLRKDKNKLPDIDIDFETERRNDVIDYLLQKYKGHAARICSYGLYKVDNLLNDLFKVCGLALADKDDPQKQYMDDDVKTLQKEIKSTVKKYVDEETGNFDLERAMQDRNIRHYNAKYNNIIKHFSKLYKKVRFFGTHAAGVAISGGNIKNYTAIERRAKGVFTTTYDLMDIEKINAVKFDMLGLRTMSIIKELRKLTKTEDFDYDWLNDEKIFAEFRKGNTDGIFQFESKSGQSILQEIGTDCMGDVIAASALNRPGPLYMGMVQQYAENKNNLDNAKQSVWYEYAKDSYGTFVYQEQIMRLCVGLAEMEWSDADKMMKIMKSAEKLQEMRNDKNSDLYVLQDKFLQGCKSKGIKKSEAQTIFNSLLVYAFNKGHATGYAIISVEQMYYKVYHPTAFWYVTLKYAKDTEKYRLSGKAVHNDCVILIPHVNHGASYKLKKIDGDVCICEGMTTIKNVGLNAAQLIEKERIENGRYESFEDFMARIEPYKRTVNKRCIEALREAGALEFNETTYYKKVEQYNTTLYAIGSN